MAEKRITIDYALLTKGLRLSAVDTERVLGQALTASGFDLSQPIRTNTHNDGKVTYIQGASKWGK